MSGGGPDVFITQCVGDFSNTQIGNPIFAMPEKAMELGLFLPLDEYIENAKYSEWDKFTKSVMDSGKNEEGQQLIPLTYTLPSALYRKSDFVYTPDYDMTREEMLASEEVYDAAVRLGDCFSRKMSFSAIWRRYVKRLRYTWITIWPKLHIERKLISARGLIGLAI